MPVSTLRWTLTTAAMRSASWRSARTRFTEWTVTAMPPRTTSSISPATIAPRITMGAVIPESRSASASVESPTPSAVTPRERRCQETGIAPCP